MGIGVSLCSSPQIIYLFILYKNQKKKKKPKKKGLEDHGREVTVSAAPNWLRSPCCSKIQLSLGHRICKTEGFGLIVLSSFIVIKRVVLHYGNRNVITVASVMHLLLHSFHCCNSCCICRLVSCPNCPVHSLIYLAYLIRLFCCSSRFLIVTN